MDTRHRGSNDRDGSDRIVIGGGDMPPRRMPSSRWSSGGGDDHSRFPRPGGGGGGARFHPYNRGPPPQDSNYPPPVAAPAAPAGGGGAGGPGYRDGPGAGGFGQQPAPMGGSGGPKRGFFGRGGGGSPPDYGDGNKIVKLFVGSVPRTVTEEDIRPLFEEHGNVIEVALIRDRKTGQQQGFCFVKYATTEEADRAIAALHNQHTLPGALAPLQVRYADGDRERQEDKLFVASLNKRATEQEIAEIFSPYGHVEDVYLMRDDLRQSRGCGFVRFSNREMAAAAMNAMHGTYVMRGCDQPLIVRFADPKRPRPELRGGPAFGGPGFSHRSEMATGTGPTNRFDEPVAGRIPSNNAWGQASPQSRGPSSQAGGQGFGNNPSAKVGMMDTSSVATGFLGETGPGAGHQSKFAAPAAQPGFNSSLPQIHPGGGQQMLPLQKPLMTPQQLPPLQSLHNQQISSSHLQGQTMQQPLQQHQAQQSTSLLSMQTLPSQQLPGLSGSLATSQPLHPPNAPASALQTPVGLSQHGMSAIANQQQLTSSTISQQQMQRPIQQMPSQVPQSLLQQQAQALQSSYQSSHQAIMQLQQQLQLMQQSGLAQLQTSQNPKQQLPWSGPQLMSSAPASTTTAVMPSASVTPSVLVANASAAALTCNWTEHTSPEGFKYYYNSVTRESKWEKPEEYLIFEQQQQQQKLLLLQQQQQKLAVQQLQPTAQTQTQTQVQPNQQVPQAQQFQTQMQLRQQAQLQLLQPSLAYPSSAVGNQKNVQDFNYGQLQAVNNVTDTSRVPQGIQAPQELSWQNKPSGS